MVTTVLHYLLDNPVVIVLLMVGAGLLLWRARRRSIRIPATVLLAEKAILKNFSLLSVKPIIYVANVNEDDMLDEGKNNEYVKVLDDFAKQENSGTTFHGFY